MIELLESYGGLCYEAVDHVQARSTAGALLAASCEPGPWHLKALNQLARRSMPPTSLLAPLEGNERAIRSDFRPIEAS